jgi:hypothetical protein
MENITFPKKIKSLKDKINILEQKPEFFDQKFNEIMEDKKIFLTEEFLQTFKAVEKENTYSDEIHQSVNHFYQSYLTKRKRLVNCKRKIILLKVLKSKKKSDIQN